MNAARIPFVDLRPADDGAAVEAAVRRVIDRGWFILGPEVEAFETEFAAASGVRHAAGTGVPVNSPEPKMIGSAKKSASNSALISVPSAAASS